jgi:hypothetical protein
MSPSLLPSFSLPPLFVSLSLLVTLSLPLFFVFLSPLSHSHTLFLFPPHPYLSPPPSHYLSHTFTSLYRPLSIFLFLPPTLLQTQCTSLICLPLSSSHTLSLYHKLFIPPLFLPLHPFHTLTHSLSTSPLFLPLSPSHTIAHTISISPLCLPLYPSHTLTKSLSTSPLCLPLFAFHTLTH